MKPQWLLSVTAVLLIAAWANADQAGKAELEKFTGIWIAVSFERDGKPVDESEVKQLKLVVSEDKYVLHRGDELIEGTHMLDPAHTPKHIDAVRTTGPDAGKTLRGIYEMDRELFRVCFGPPAGDRPSEFTTTSGGGQRLMVFKRETTAEN